MAADSELFNRTKCSVAVQRLYGVTDNNSINVHRISLRELAFGSLPSYIYIYSHAAYNGKERCGKGWTGLAVHNEGV